MNNVKYEKGESVFSKVFSSFKKKESSKVYDVELPALSKTIVDSNILSQNPMQPKEEKTIKDLPALNISRNISRISDELESIKKVDISRVEQKPENNSERIVYLREEEKSRQDINAIQKTNILIDKSESGVILEAGKKSSFFSGIISHVDKEGQLLDDKKYINSEILSKNILSEMKTHWHSKKDEIKLGIRSKEAQDRIFSKIEELKSLESEWQQKELMIEELKKQIDFTEQMIEEKGIELKKAIKAAKYGETAKNPFFLKNGKAVRSVNELLEVLKVLDSNTFNEHVNEMRNDFSSWIVNEFNDAALALRVKDAYSKEDLVAILEMF